MNAKLNFLSKHKENRPFCAKALLLAVALWFACAAGALAQGIVEYALIINGVGEEPSIYINLEITGHEKSEEIKDASDLVSACNRQTITEDILYKLKGNIVASQIFTVNKCLKLDLNGHSITSSATKCFNINDNAGLTIVDSSTDEQKGSINCTYNDDSDAVYINSGSKFIADGVTITCAKGSAITNVSGTAKISGCTIKDYSVSGIKNAGGTVTLNDWPTFSAGSAAGVSDIWLHQGNTITIGSAITAAPTKEISVRVTDNNDNDLTADALPATITSGYAEKVKSDATTVIDPAEVFTYYKRDAYHIVTLDAATSSEAVLAAIPMEVTYIDPTKPVGQQECTIEAYVLDGSETVLGSDGKTTWYVSNTPKSSAKPNGITFTNDVTLAGDVCIILADGSAMTVQGSISGAGKSLYLYGQEGSTGSLDFWSIACNDVTITGGIISSGNTNGNVIACSNNISITGGQVTIPSSNSGYGSLVTSGDHRIYLGWTLPTDCYNIGIYDAPLIALQENKRFVAYDAATGTAATAVLSNSVSKDSEAHYSSINGKCLRPVNGNIVTPGEGISVGTLSGTTFTATDPDFTITTDAGTESEVTTPYYIYSADSKVNMNYTGEFGTDDKSVTYTLTGATLDDYDYFGGTNGAHQNADGRLASFTMPANDVTASASLNPFTQPGGYCGKSNVNNGKNLVWTVTDVGTGSNQVRTLTISKNPDDDAISGQTYFDMANYDNYNASEPGNFAPWIKPNTAGNKSDGLKYPITTVTIADGVTSVGQKAFDNCSGLQNVTIGNNVTTIGQSAFDHCSGLQIVTIGNSVTSIGNQAFDYCSGLQKVNIGNSVTNIGGYAFRGCEELQEVSIGSSVTTIGDHAFDGCKILQEVTIPASVTTIDDGAFNDCFGLTVVTMSPITPPRLDGDIFVHCLLKLILVPNETAYDDYNAAGGGWDGKYSADINTEPEDITYKSLLAPSEISLAKNTSGWGTYCHRYPISYSLSEDATAYTLSGLNDAKTAVTTTATTGNVVAPLTPLLLNYTAPDNDTETDDETVTLTALPATATRVCNDVIVNNGNTGWNYYGNTTGTTLTHDPNSDPDDGIPALTGGWPTYILRNGTFVLIDTDEGIPAHRCVLSVGSSSAARVLTIGIDDETTAIESEKVTVNSEKFAAATVWYDLQGRKLDKQPTKKGLYINNGKKTVIK